MTNTSMMNFCIAQNKLESNNRIEMVMVRTVMNQKQNLPKLQVEVYNIFKYSDKRYLIRKQMKQMQQYQSLDDSIVKLLKS